MVTSPKTKSKIAIFASGNGSNAEALLNYAKNHGYLASIATLITDNPEAKVIERAVKYDVATKVFPIQRKAYLTFSEAKEAQEAQIFEHLQKCGVNWILLAGYMRILSSNFLQKFYNEEKKVNQVVNIHPSLLPEFPGKDGYGDAFRAQVKTSGVTIHFVDNDIDTGPMIMQERFQRAENDDLASFKARGLLLEHKIYPQILVKIINGTLLEEVNL